MSHTTPKYQLVFYSLLALTKGLFHDFIQSVARLSMIGDFINILSFLYISDMKNHVE